MIAEVQATERTAPVELSRVVDTSEVQEFDIDPSAGRSFGKRRVGAPLKNSGKKAVIVHRKIEFAFARRFLLLSDHPQVEIRMVNHLLEAVAWCIEDETSPS